MDSAWLIQTALGLGIGIVSWIVRGLFERVEKQQEKIQQLELQLARDYHDKADLAHMLDEKIKPLQDLLEKVVNWIEAQSGGVPIKRGV